MFSGHFGTGTATRMLKHLTTAWLSDTFPIDSWWRAWTLTARLLGLQLPTLLGEAHSFPIDSILKFSLPILVGLPLCGERWGLPDCLYPGLSLGGELWDGDGWVCGGVGCRGGGWPLLLTEQGHSCKKVGSWGKVFRGESAQWKLLCGFSLGSDVCQGPTVL